MAPTQPSFQTILKLLYGSDFLPKAYILLPVQYGKAHETPHKMACKALGPFKSICYVMGVEGSPIEKISHMGLPKTVF